MGEEKESEWGLFLSNLVLGSEKKAAYFDPQVFQEKDTQWSSKNI